MKNIDRNSVIVTYVLPNGPDVLGAYNDHVVSNFRAGQPAAAQLLTAFRMAKLVTGELAPLILSSYKELK